MQFFALVFRFRNDKNLSRKINLQQFRKLLHMIGIFYGNVSYKKDTLTTCFVAIYRSFCYFFTNPKK